VPLCGARESDLGSTHASRVGCRALATTNFSEVPLYRIRPVVLKKGVNKVRTGKAPLPAREARALPRIRELQFSITPHQLEETNRITNGMDAADFVGVNGCDWN
jgi:hypothetical protein